MGRTAFLAAGRAVVNSLFTGHQFSFPHCDHQHPGIPQNAQPTAKVTACNTSLLV
uniref:Uncharacterized protein n=1 Tax=Setaria viridis TaxID=4556 RepID=A0A4U6VYG5_SETVI|nr:hypothetical protein SEVIR_2G346250v2 [Setaria viridis]